MRNLLSTLFSYIDQLVMSSESMPPSKPKRALDAPTEILCWMKREESKLPPNPDITNSSPISTVLKNNYTIVKKIFCMNYANNNEIRELYTS